VCRRLYKNIWGNLEAVSAINSGIEKIDSGEATVYSVVETIIDEIKTDGQANIE
tara:strand:+ start:1842 stop:2003 length:162 start_codon:yes stop_codon:yes gene_type:complete